MLKWIKESDYFHCAWLTLIGSSTMVLLPLLVLAASNVPMPEIEEMMVRASVPWFVFWYVSCKLLHDIKIHPPRD